MKIPGYAVDIIVYSIYTFLYLMFYIIITKSLTLTGYNIIIKVFCLGMLFIGAYTTTQWFIGVYNYIKKMVNQNG